MRTTIRSSLVAVGLAALLATPSVAPAQNVYGGLAGGVGGLAGGVIYHSPVVFTVQASIGRRISRRFETRLDAFASLWDGGAQDVLCAFGVPPQACHPPTSVEGLVGNGVVNVTAPARGPRLYLIGGVGAYYFNLGFGSSDEMALGVSGGVGCAVSTGRRFRVVLDARYHHVVDGRHWLADIMPVVLGIQF